MKRVALGVLFGAAAASFAVLLRTAPAWLMLVVALVSIFKHFSLGAIHDSARRLLYAGLVATVGFGWFVMVYPVMSDSAMRLWSLAIGYTLGALGCLFLLSGRSPGSTVIPAAAGLLVVASFDLEAAIHPYLGVAGVAGILYLGPPTK